MEIIKNYDLTKLNTFGISVRAKFFVELNDEFSLKKLFISPEFKNNEKLFLGGGSNILFTKDFDGIVILNRLKGIKILEENSESVFIRSMGGEIWHDLVMFTVNHGYWGIENLSFIPGTVGAAPIQNIGAYGGELKDTMESLEAVEIQTGEKKVFYNKECEFGYRDSIFKQSKDIILEVVLILEEGDKEKIKDEMKKILKARNEKLPLDFPSAGSVFKNVKVTDEILEKLKNCEIPSKFIELGKIPVAWLVEQCNLKGKQTGGAKISEKHANFIVNIGKATAKEVAELIELVKAEISQKFGVKLEEEIELVLGQ